MTKYERREASGRNKHVFIACLSIPPFAPPYQKLGFLWGSVIYTHLSFTPHLPNGVAAMQLEVRQFTLDSGKSNFLTEKICSGYPTPSNQQRTGDFGQEYRTKNIYLPLNDSYVATMKYASCGSRQRTEVHISRETQRVDTIALFKPWLLIILPLERLGI